MAHNNNANGRGDVKRQLLIMAAGIVVVILFFILPANTTWIKEKLVGYWNDFVVQRKNLSLEERKTKRFGTTYSYSKQIAGLLAAKTKNKQVLLLMPSVAYFKKMGLDYPVPDPITFYYFTDVKTVQVQDSNAIDANWFVTVSDKKISVDSVVSMVQLKDSISAFK
jgi:hypothetical protein